MSNELLIHFNKSQTLFLDRDGVINVRKHDGYITTPEDFIFVPGALQTIVKLTSFFQKTIVVTNQQGIGKGLYSHADLQAIHEKMLQEVRIAGGRIDDIFYAHQLAAENSSMRKPNIGMALAAKDRFPEIEFSNCIMVGDTISDMQFARNAGMIAVLCTEEDLNFPADLRVRSLQELAALIPE